MKDFREGVVIRLIYKLSQPGCSVKKSGAGLKWRWKSRLGNIGAVKMETTVAEALQLKKRGQIWGIFYS